MFFYHFDIKICYLNVLRFTSYSQAENNQSFDIQLNKLNMLQVVTVRGTNFDASAADGGSAATESLDVPADLPLDLSAFLKSELAKSDRPELTAAKVNNTLN